MKAKKTLSPLGKVIMKALDGRTQKWLSAKIHVSQSALGFIISGRNNANSVTLYAISTVLPIDYETLARINKEGINERVVD